MARLPRNLWTLVQHSGFGYAGKPGLETMVEERAVETVGEYRRIEKEGGVAFDTYREAAIAGEYINGIYDDGDGLYPTVRRGSFAKSEIDGLKIFVPNDAVTLKEKVKELENE